MKVITVKQPFASLIAAGINCVLIDGKMRDKLKEENAIVYSNVINDTEWNGYGFKLENARKIEPIPINGKLSLWDYDYKE